MEQEQIKKPDRGLGDTIARYTAMTRIDRLAQRVAVAVGAKDCGCSDRQNLLNEIFPYIKNIKKENNKQ